MEYKIKEITDKQQIQIAQEDGLSYKNNSKIIEINGKEIGFYTPFFLWGKLTIEYNLFKRFRNQGLGFAFVNIVTEQVGKDYPEINEIFLSINAMNIPSLKVAIENGYSPYYDETLNDMVNEKMPIMESIIKRMLFIKNITLVNKIDMD